MKTLLIFAALFWICSLSQGQVAKLQLRLVKFSNPNGQGDNGHCCDGRWRICQRNGCDHYFIICLDETSSSNSTDNCKYHTVTTGATKNQNEIFFSTKIGDTSNPMVIPMNVGPFSLKVNVYDRDSVGSDDFVDFIRADLNVLKGSTVKKELRGRHTTLYVEALMICNDNQFGPRCDTYCKPGGNVQGCNHFTGRKICKQGWMGENCTEKEPSCPSGWKLWSGRCYLISSKELTWTDARKDCQRMGGDLLVINSWNEQRFIKGELLERVKDRKYGGEILLWIGLNDRRSEGTWVWNDNVPLAIRNWRYGEPNNQRNEDCGSIYQRYSTSWAGKWNDINCDSSQINFICEKSPTSGGDQENGSG